MRVDWHQMYSVLEAGWHVPPSIPKELGLKDVAEDIVSSDRLSRKEVRKLATEIAFRPRVQLHSFLRLGLKMKLRR